MTIVSFNKLKEIRKNHKNKKIVFCSGCFDLTHAGHVLFLEDCKAHGDILVVGVGKDKTLIDLKGTGRPVFNEKMRLKVIDSLKPVDYAFLELYLPGEHFLKQMESTFKHLSPDIYVFNSDASEIKKRKEIAKRFAVDVKTLRRKAPKSYDQVSTTKIISKIQNLK